MQTVSPGGIVNHKGSANISVTNNLSIMFITAKQEEVKQEEEVTDVYVEAALNS